MLSLFVLSLGCGETLVVDGIRDIQNLPLNGNTCLNVHQSWKTADVPEKYAHLVESWRDERVRNVLWTDQGNLDLVEHFYIEWSAHYSRLLNLPMYSGGNVMASDWARLLYIHKFGGLYVDLDYEAHVSPADWPVISLQFFTQREVNPLFFVKSPFLITEVMQNSLVYSPEPGHPFLYAACRSIVNTLDFIEHPYCPDDQERTVGSAVSAKCPLTGAFSNPWTKSVTWLMKTEQITGPPVLDKTFTELSLAKDSIVESVHALPTSDFFGTVGSSSIGPGKYATHWHANSWVTLNPVRLMPELTITLLLLFLVVFAGAFFAGKNERLIRNLCSA